jgi:CRISPR-associated protein Cmr2
MNNVLSVLSPPKIQKNEYEKIVKDIISQLQSNSDASGIRELINRYGDKPFSFIKSGNQLENKRCAPSIRDAASIYVLIKYLQYYKNKTSPGDSFNAPKHYMKFFSDEWDEAKDFIYNFMCNDPNTNSNLLSDIEIDIVSGSVYKIKRYFLENSKIKDIRGGSALIKYVNEDATFDYLRKSYIEECAIYCGGGNVLLVAPGGEGEEICSALENKYSEITLTALNAFVYERTNLNEFVKNYKGIMNRLNRKLDERKKLKIYDINPDNSIKMITIGNVEIRFDNTDEIDEKGIVCHLCGVRDGKYKVRMPDGETAVVCPSCQRKHEVGKEKTIFYDEYRDFTGSSVIKKIGSIIELGDENGHVAVIYADGNNMGNVVKNIETPFQHMYFSRTLDRTTKECVYKSVYEVMKDEAMFEAIALGGDDIFIVVPGDKSLEITNKIIEKFDSKFENKMTMSAGICIAKSTTPIKTMFEVDQAMLRSAKKYSREGNNSEGTVDIQLIRSNIGTDLQESESSLFPAVNSELSSYLEIMRSLKTDSKIKSSQIYKFSNAWRIMKNPMEFQLFYLYQVARLSSRYNDYIQRFLNSIKSLEDNPYRYCGLMHRKSGSSGGSDYICLWDDITLLMDASGR